MSSLHRRLAHHPATARLTALPLTLHLRAALATGRWRVEGREALCEALDGGPVILALWHEHLALSAAHWPDGHPISAVHGSAPIARAAGAVMARFGTTPIALGDGTLAASRRVMAALRQGRSIGLAVDGPKGPRRVPGDAVLDWARSTGAPLWGYAFATRSDRRLPSWDRLLLPRLFDRGVAVFAPLDLEVPRRLDPDRREALRVELARQLDALADKVSQELAAG